MRRRVQYSSAAAAGLAPMDGPAGAAPQLAAAARAAPTALAAATQMRGGGSLKQTQWAGLSRARLQHSDSRLLRWPSPQSKLSGQTRRLPWHLGPAVPGCARGAADRAWARPPCLIRPDGLRAGARAS